MGAPSTEKKTILNLYAAFGVSLVLCFIPSVSVALIALLFLAGVLIAAYVMRSKAEAESLTQNHTNFIIRTIWGASAISLVTLTIGSIFMLQGIDYAAFSACNETLAAKGPTADFQEMYALAAPCMNNFIEMNMSLLTITALGVALPVIFYVLIRYARGLGRAVKGYRMAHPESWL